MDNTKQLAPLMPEEPTTDITPVDQARIDAYKEAGLPGLYALKESQVSKILELYLDGKPYIQISRMMKVDKALIMYMSQKFNWFMTRKDYNEELELSMRQRLIDAKLASQDFLLDLKTLYEKKIGRKISSYLTTGNDEHANAIDPKEVSLLLKILDNLEKSVSDGKSGKQGVSPVNLGIGDGVTIAKNAAGGVDITPKQKSVGEMLKQFADAQREEELKNSK